MTRPPPSPRRLPTREPHGAKPRPGRAQLALAFATVYGVWGSTYACIRVAVETIPPFALAGARFALAGAVLFGVARLRGVRAPRRRDWARAGVSGLLTVGIGNGLVCFAETRVPSALAGLLVASVPLYVALMDWGRPGGVRPRAPVLLGILLGGAGLSMVLSPGGEPAAAGHWLGVACVLIAAAGWAAGSLYVRYRASHESATMAAAQQMLVGGAALGSLALLSGELSDFDPRAISLDGLLAFAYLTVFGSIVAYGVFTWLLGVTTPERVSTTAYVNPVVAMLLGWLLLGETLSETTLAGAALVIGAVVLMLRPTRVSPAETAPGAVPVTGE